MDDFIQTTLALHSPELVLIGEEYIDSGEDLLAAAKELQEKGQTAIDTLKPRYEGQFKAAWIKDDALKEMIREFGVTGENKSFILTEMKKIAKMNRDIASLIRNLIKELPV